MQVERAFPKVHSMLRNNPSPLQQAMDAVISAKKSQNDRKLSTGINQLKYRIFQVLFRGKEHERLELLASLQLLLEKRLIDQNFLGWILEIYLTREIDEDVKKAVFSRILKWNDQNVIPKKTLDMLKQKIRQLEETRSKDDVDSILAEYLPQFVFRLIKDDEFTDQIISNFLESKSPHVQEFALKILSFDAQLRHVTPSQAFNYLEILFKRMNIIVHQKLARQPDPQVIQWMKYLLEELEDQKRYELLARTISLSKLFSEIIDHELVPFLLYLGKTRDKKQLKQYLQYLGNSFFWKELSAQEKEQIYLRLEESEFPLDSADIVMAIEGDEDFL